MAPILGIPGLGWNMGLLSEVNPGTRLGLAWSSAVDLDCNAPAKFSGLALAAQLRHRLFDAACYNWKF